MEVIFIVTYLCNSKFLTVLGFDSSIRFSNKDNIDIDIEVFHCDVCTQNFWIGRRMQKCLRKDVICPICDMKKNNKGVFKKAIEFPFNIYAFLLKDCWPTIRDKLILS